MKQQQQHLHNLELWLVRHGQTEGNLNGRLVGWEDTLLTELGKSQASALRPILENETFDGVWSSDLIRTVTTARLAFGEPTPDPRLREIHFGDLEGQKWDEIDKQYQDALIGFENFSAPNGESLADFKARLHGFVEQLPSGRHLIVAHGGVIRMLTQPLGLHRFVPNGTLIVLDWPQQQVKRVHPPLPEQ